MALDRSLPEENGHALSNGARRKSWVASPKEGLAEIPKTIAKKADPLTLGSPVHWSALLPPSRSILRCTGSTLRPASGGNVKRVADPRKGSDREIISGAAPSLPAGSFPRRDPHSFRSDSPRFESGLLPAQKLPRSPFRESLAGATTRIRTSIQIFFGLQAYPPPPKPIDLERLRRRKFPKPFVAFKLPG